MFSIREWLPEDIVDASSISFYVDEQGQPSFSLRLFGCPFDKLAKCKAWVGREVDLPNQSNNAICTEIQTETSECSYFTVMKFRLCKKKTPPKKLLVWDVVGVIDVFAEENHGL